MTVPVQDTFNESTANGVTTTFPYSFKLLSADDLVVTVNDVQVTTGFTVTGIGNDSGGNVVFDVAPLNGQTVLRKRVLAADRVTDYQENGDFPASTVDNDFDRIWMYLQQLAHDIVRAIKLPFTTTTDQTITQDAAGRANKALVFNASGDLTLQAYSSDTVAAIAAGASADAAAASEAAAQTAQTAAEAAEAQALVNAGLTPGRLVDIQIFSASGTWTKPANLTAEALVMVEAVGGGGPGGPATGAASQIGIGGGGVGGGYVRACIAASDLGATEAVSVGAAGVIGVSYATPSDFAGLRAFEGATVSTVPAGTTFISEPPATGGSGTVTDAHPWTILEGRGSTVGARLRIDGTKGMGQTGGSTPFGEGGAGGGLNTNGGINHTGWDATGYGSGGGGAISDSTTTYNGGAGKGGLVIVYTYS